MGGSQCIPVTVVSSLDSYFRLGPLLVPVTGHSLDSEGSRPLEMGRQKSREIVRVTWPLPFMSKHLTGSSVFWCVRVSLCGVGNHTLGGPSSSKTRPVVVGVETLVAHLKPL